MLQRVSLQCNVVKSGAVITASSSSYTSIAPQLYAGAAMTLRRPSWSSPALHRPSSLILCLASSPVGPSRRWRKSGDVERRRGLASLTTSQHIQSQYQTLLAAVQRKDLPGTSDAFFAWVDSFDEDLAVGHPDLAQLDAVPSTVLSEILRSMDPVRRPELDVLHSLSFTQGSMWSTDVGKLIDEFGVRRHHKRAAEAVQKLIRLRQGSSVPLSPSDFEVILRIAGASLDFNLPSVIMSKKKLMSDDWGRTRGWVDYLKARFLTEPLYYQHNRNYLALSARDRVNHEIMKKEPEMVKSLDKVRYSMNHMSRLPWTRRRDMPEVDLRRVLRRPWTNYRGYLNHWHRMDFIKLDVDVEFLSLSIEAFARSDDRQRILELILRGYYGIEVSEETEMITGGFDMDRNSPIYPTPRLQHAILEAFGAMGDISLAMQLIDFIARRYDVPIPREIWSNLLSWTYVCASTGNSSYHRKWTSLDKVSISTSVKDVQLVWNLMTSPPYNIEPSFDDLDIYIRALIISHRFDLAIKELHERAMPFYDVASQELEEAVADEVLLSDLVREHYFSRRNHSDGFSQPSTPPATTAALNAARRRRHEAEAHKDYITHHINKCVIDILKQSSTSRAARASPTFTTVTIPHLLRDFWHFFFHGVDYRTATGRVQIRSAPELASPRFRRESQSFERSVLRTNLGGAEVFNKSHDKHGNPKLLWDEEQKVKVPNPEFEWPMTGAMTVKEVKRVPRTRPATLRWPPLEDDGFRNPSTEEWRHKLESQLSM